MRSDKIVSAPVINENLSRVAFDLTCESKKTDGGRSTRQSLIADSKEGGFSWWGRHIATGVGDGDGGGDSSGGSSSEIRRKSCEG